MTTKPDGEQYIQTYPDGTMYFRFRGKVFGSLPGPRGSPEFLAEWRRLHALHVPADTKGKGRPQKIARPKAKQSTIAFWIERWKGSIEWESDPAKKTDETYSDGSKQFYNRVIKGIVEDGLADSPLAALNPHSANVYLQAVKRKHGGARAIGQKVLLSNLWRFARGFAEFEGAERPNPMRSGNIDKLYSVKQEHRPWPQKVQKKFVAASQPHMVLVFFMLLCTGQRESDIIQMKWEHYDGTHITLIDGQQKSQDDEPMRIKVPKVLKAILDTTERRCDFICTQKWGKPWANSSSISKAIKNTLYAIGGGHYTAHGLRKNAGIMLAENGATVPQIMAALGHKTERMALYYIRLANKALLNDQAAEIIDRAMAAAALDQVNRENAERRSRIKLVRA